MRRQRQRRRRRQNAISSSHGDVRSFYANRRSFVRPSVRRQIWRAGGGREGGSGPKPSGTEWGRSGRTAVRRAGDMHAMQFQLSYVDSFVRHSTHVVCPARLRRRRRPINASLKSVGWRRRRWRRLPRQAPCLAALPLLSLLLMLGNICQTRRRQGGLRSADGARRRRLVDCFPFRGFGSTNHWNECGSESRERNGPPRS